MSLRPLWVSSMKNLKALGDSTLLKKIVVVCNDYVRVALCLYSCREEKEKIAYSFGWNTPSLAKVMCNWRRGWCQFFHYGGMERHSRMCQEGPLQDETLHQIQVAWTRISGGDNVKAAFDELMSKEPMPPKKPTNEHNPITCDTPTPEKPK